MSYGNQTKLYGYFFMTSHVEPFEAVIEFDVTEDSLGFDRTIASMIQSSFTGQQFTRFLPVFLTLMVYFYTSIVLH